MSEPHATAIVLAAGAGRRLGGGEPKAFRLIGGRPMLSIAAASAVGSPAVHDVVVTAPPDSLDKARVCVEGLEKPVRVVAGGPTRQRSVQQAIAGLPPGTEFVAVHDGARPFAPPELFTLVLAAVRGGADGAIPVIPAADTVKRVADGLVVGTQDREDLALAQTPQAFRLTALRDSLDRAVEAGMDFTDDAASLEWGGYRVETVAGDPGNFKVTTYSDLARAERRMAGDGPGRLPRVGSGFDVHRFDPARPLLLGGVLFEGESGLAGHSDGDVVCHALADALLGAASLGDVGQHFPESDPQIAGIAGADLLSGALELIRLAGFEPSSVDLTIICERPAIAPRREEIKEALAAVLGLGAGGVSVKATRPEGLGLSGDGIGCLATAVVG